MHQLTTTPLNIFMIFGLPFISARVPIGESLPFNTTMVRGLIDQVADVLPLGACYAPRSVVAKGLTLQGTTEEQKIRILLWLAVCGVLRTDRRSRVSVQYLKLLEDLSRVSTYEWAELGYCSLLSCLHTACR